MLIVDERQLSLQVHAIQYPPDIDAANFPDSLITHVGTLAKMIHLKLSSKTNAKYFFSRFIGQTFTNLL